MTSQPHTPPHRLAVVGLILALIAVAACNGTGIGAPRSPATPTSPSATPSGLTRQTPSQDFLAIVKPSVTLGIRLDAQLQDMLVTGSGLQAANLLYPWIEAIVQTQFQVAGVAWPPQVTNDLTIWLLDDNAVANDIRGVLYIPAGDLSAWYQHEERDVSATGAALNVVRTDLGLPLTVTDAAPRPAVEASSPGRHHHDVVPFPLAAPR
jgi:hypothetical protein